MTRIDPNLVLVEGELQDKPEPTLRRSEGGKSFLYFKIESIRTSDDGQYKFKTWPLIKMFGKPAEWAAEKINKGGSRVRVTGELSSAKNKDDKYELVVVGKSVDVIGDAETTAYEPTDSEIPF